MEFKHFSHTHGLVFHQLHQGSQVQCSGCKTPGNGNVYVCWQCSYYLHEHCYRATRSLRNPSHPLHPLTLMPYPTHPSNAFICNSCHIAGNGFSYCCAECDFDLHIHCANNNNPYPAPNISQSYVSTTNPIYPPIHTNPFPGYNPPHNPTSIPNDIPSFSQPQGAAYPPMQSSPFPTYPNPNPTLPNGSQNYTPQAAPQTPMYPPAQSSPVPGYPQPNLPPTQSSPMPGYPQPNPPPAYPQPNPPPSPMPGYPQPNPPPAQSSPPPAYPQPNPPPTQSNPPPAYPQPTPPQTSFNPQVSSTPTTNPPVPPIYTPPLTSITVTPPPAQTNTPPTSSTTTVSQPTENSSQPKPPSLIKHFSHPHVLQPMELEKNYAKVCSACECELSGSAYCCTEANCTFNLHKACFDSPIEVRHKCHLDHPLTLLTAPPYKDGFTCNACLKDGKAFAYHCSTCSYDLHIDCITWPEAVTRQDHKHPLNLYYSSPAGNSNQEVVFMCDVCKNPVHEMAWVYYCRECDYGTHLECVASGMQPNVTVGGQTDEELLRETQLKFAVLQLLLNGGLTVTPGK